MYRLGYLAIDTELGGPNYLTGEDAILEIALLAFPDPKESGLGRDEFLKVHLDDSKIKNFIIRPYANANKYILDNILKRPLEYYEKNGIEISDASSMILDSIKELKRDYEKIEPVSDWQGDVTVLEYVLSRSGANMVELLNEHNMLHLKSYVRGEYGRRNRYGQSNAELKITTIPDHTAKTDCKVIAETAIKMVYKEMKEQDRRRNRQREKIRG